MDITILDDLVFCERRRQQPPLRLLHQHHLLNQPSLQPNPAVSSAETRSVKMLARSSVRAARNVRSFSVCRGIGYSHRRELAKHPEETAMQRAATDEAQWYIWELTDDD